MATSPLMTTCLAGCHPLSFDHLRGADCADGPFASLLSSRRAPSYPAIYNNKQLQLVMSNNYLDNLEICPVKADGTTKFFAMSAQKAVEEHQLNPSYWTYKTFQCENLPADVTGPVPQGKAVVLIQPVSCGNYSFVSVTQRTAPGQLISEVGLFTSPDPDMNAVARNRSNLWLMTRFPGGSQATVTFAPLSIADTVLHADPAADNQLSLAPSSAKDLKMNFTFVL